MPGCRSPQVIGSGRLLEPHTLVEDVRRISRTSPSTCLKIRYSNRIDTVTIMLGLEGAPITAGQQRVPRSGTPQASRQITPARRMVLGIGANELIDPAMAA